MLKFYQFFVLDKIESKRKRLRTGNELNVYDIAPHDGRKFFFDYFTIFFLLLFIGEGQLKQISKMVKKLESFFIFHYFF